MVGSEEKMVSISARIRRSQAEELGRIAAERGIDRSEVVRELLALGLRENRLKEALDSVRAGRVSVWRAAEMAGVSYQEMLGLLRSRNIPFPLSLQELRVELEEMRGRK